MSSKPSLPGLPIEIWFQIYPFFDWEVARDGPDFLFRYKYRESPAPEPGRRFLGRKFVADLAGLQTPQELVRLMNVSACPIDGVVQDEVDGEWHRTTVPFRWSEFLDFQKKLKQAMRLPIAKLQQLPEFKSAFNLTGFGLLVERRRDAYFGTVTTAPIPEECLRVIAVDRLLGGVRYGFCKRCGNPFEITSRHKRKYCDAAICGHAVAQGRYRLRLKRKMKDRHNRK